MPMRLLKKRKRKSKKSVSFLRQARQKFNRRPAKHNSCKKRDVFGLFLTVFLIVAIIGVLSGSVVQNAFYSIFGGDSAVDIPDSIITIPEDNGDSDVDDNEGDDSDVDDNEGDDSEQFDSPLVEYDQFDTPLVDYVPSSENPFINLGD